MAGNGEKENKKQKGERERNRESFQGKCIEKGGRKDAEKRRTKIHERERKGARREVEEREGKERKGKERKA